MAEAIIDEANRIGLRALVHAMDAKDVNQLVEWGIDGFVHPPGISADNNGDLLGTAGRKGLAVAVTIGTPEIMAETFGEPSEEDLQDFNLTKDNIRSMIAFGAKPVLGSDLPGFPPDKVLRTTIAALASLGLSNAEVLWAATRDAAQGLLALADVGTLEPGNMADMIVMPGDPLQDLDALQNLSMVIQGGAVVLDRPLMFSARMLRLSALACMGWLCVSQVSLAAEQEQGEPGADRPTPVTTLRYRLGRGAADKRFSIHRLPTPPVAGRQAGRPGLALRRGADGPARSGSRRIRPAVEEHPHLHRL